MATHRSASLQWDSDGVESGDDSQDALVEACFDNEVQAHEHKQRSDNKSLNVKRNEWLKSGKKPLTLTDLPATSKRIRDGQENGQGLKFGCVHETLWHHPATSQTLTETLKTG